MPRSVDHRDHVVAVIVAGSAHALAPVAGVPMVVRAVRALLGSELVERVTVAAPGELEPAIERACAADPVGVGVPIAQRSGATSSDEDIVLLHDACRPLAPTALAVAVVEAVRSGHGMAVPTVPLTDTVKAVDGRGLVTGTADRELLRVLQTPIGVRAGLLPACLGEDPLAVIRRHMDAGGSVYTVPGHPAAFAVRTDWDLDLAELVAGGRIHL